MFFFSAPPPSPTGWEVSWVWGLGDILLAKGHLPVIDIFHCSIGVILELLGPSQHNEQSIQMTVGNTEMTARKLLFR
jgi:hypothetical protein